MATLYAKIAGGNWSAAATWSNISAAGVDNSGPPTSADDVIIGATAGNLTIDAAANAKSIDCTGYVGTITHNSFTLTVAGNLKFVAGMTYAHNNSGSTIIINATCSLTTGGKLFPMFSVNSGTTTLQDNLSFAASKILTFLLSNGVGFVLNGFTVSGNSSVNRILILSSSIGNSRTITVGSGTFANADFQDIQFSKATNLDLSAITGLSGDCGGNSITGGGTVLTFTTPDTQTWNGISGGNWSANAWSGRVPLPQDDVVISSAFSGGQTITADMPRLGKSVVFTGTTGTPTFSSSITNSIFGSLTLISGLTWSNSGFNFCGRSSYTITSSGRDFNTGSVLIQAPGGTYTLNDAFTISNQFLNLSYGSFNTNNFNVTATKIDIRSSNTVYTNTITFGTSIVSLARTSGLIFQSVPTTGVVLSASSSTILVSVASASLRTFEGGGLTFGTLTYVVAGSTGELDITGANSFSTINFSDVTNARSLLFTAGTITTIRNTRGFNVQGTSGKLMTVGSITAAGHILSAVNIQACNYLSVSRSTAQGGGVWYAGANSTDGGNNSGWLFSTAPSLGGGGARASRIQAVQNLQNLKSF